MSCIPSVFVLIFAAGFTIAGQAELSNRKCKSQGELKWLASYVLSIKFDVPYSISLSPHGTEDELR